MEQFLRMCIYCGIYKFHKGMKSNEIDYLNCGNEEMEFLVSK